MFRIKIKVYIQNKNTCIRKLKKIHRVIIRMEWNKRIVKYILLQIVIGLTLQSSYICDKKSIYVDSIRCCFDDESKPIIPSAMN